MTDSSEHGPDEKTPDAKPSKRKRRRGRRKPPRGKKNPRPTVADMEQRILVVIGLLVEGNRPRAIRRFVAENHKEWGDVAPRTVDRYIATATAELSKIADESRAVAKSKVRARYELVIAKAATAELWEVVRKATRDLARLDGLEPGLRVQHGGSIELPVSGEVQHSPTHHAAGSIEERASRVSDLLGEASRRRAAATNN